MARISWASRSRRSTSRLEKGSSSSSSCGLRRQRAGQRDALLLAAGQLVREAALDAGQADQLPAPRRRGRSRSALGQAMDAEADVVAHVEVREQGVVLEHHADAPLLGAARGRRAPPTSWPEMRISPAAGALQAGDGAQQGGLAAAGRADQHADVARAQAERDVVDGGLGPARVLNAQLGDLDEHGCDCRCLQFSFASTGMSRPLHGPAPAPRPASAAAGVACWCCRCWPCWLPGCNGTAKARQVLGEMARTVLPGYVWTSLGLCLAVGVGVALVGGATAAAVTLFDFPGRSAPSSGRCCCRWPCRPTWWPTRTPTSCSSAARCRPGCASTFGLQGRVFPEVRSLRRRGAGLRLLALSLRLPAGAHGAGRAGRPPDGGGAPARRAAAPPHPPRWPCRWRARPSPPASRWR